MLRPTSERERGIAPRAASCTESLRLAFGGVAFELLMDSGEAFSLPAETLRCCLPGFDPRAIADVVCAVHVDKSVVLRHDPQDVSSSVSWTSSSADQGPIIVRSAFFRAELEPVGPRRYVVTARVASLREGLVELLRGVSAAIVHREGGLVLHAAAAELDGRAVLFVGPSGAGKSTALCLTKGSHCFAYDHAIVVRSEGRWFAWGLPGGTPANAPLAAGVVYPLSAVLRVRQSTHGSTRVSTLSGAEALFAVRESVECADDSLGAEDMYLRAVTELTLQIMIGAFSTVLGSSIVLPVRQNAAPAQGKLLA